MSKFVDMLIAKREEKKMLKRDVALMFDWTPMYYGRYENGQLKPTVSNYKKFADFLGVSVQELEKIVKEDN